MLELKKKRSSARERCVLVAIVNKQQDEEKALEYLEELRFLADTAGADTVHMFTQKLSQPNSKTFLGTGRAGPIPILASTFNAHVDSLRKTKRRDWDAWSWRDAD